MNGNSPDHSNFGSFFLKTSIHNNYCPPRNFYRKNIFHDVFSNNSTLSRNSYPKERHCAKTSKESFTVKNNGTTITTLAIELKKTQTIYPVLKKHKKATVIRITLIKVSPRKFFTINL